MALTHLRLRVGGTLFNDANWSIGINGASAQGGDPFGNGTTNVQQVLEDIRDRVRALNQNLVVPGAMADSLSTAGKITYIRTSRVGPNGRETDVALTELAQPISGTSTPFHTAQSAVVLSLLTGAPGATNRGRLYWPALGGALSNGRLQPNPLGQLALDAAIWIGQLRDAFDVVSVIPTATCVPSVVSTTRGSARPVTSVRVGNRLDSQRRRAEAQQEVYSVASVPQ